MKLNCSMKAALMSMLFASSGLLQADFELLVGTQNGFLAAESGDYLNAGSSFRVEIDSEASVPEVILLAYLDSEESVLYQGSVGREGLLLPSSEEEFRIEGGFGQLRLLAIFGSGEKDAVSECGGDVTCYEKLGVMAQQKTFRLVPRSEITYRGLRDSKVKPKRIQEDQDVYAIEFDPSKFADRTKKISKAAKKSSFDLPTRGASEVRIYRNASPSVVLIIGKDSIGSGSIIESDSGSSRILTNWHVVDGAEEIAVLLKGAKSKPSREKIHIANVIKFDPVVDLALLEVQSSLLVGSIELAAPAGLEVGEDVHAIGHPEGEFWSYTKGYISQIREDYKWKTKGGSHEAREVIQTQTPINPGNSGGPLLDENGKLVGVNSFGTDGEGMNYAISVLDVVDFLKSTNETIRKKNKKISIKSKILEKKKLDIDNDGTEELVIVVDRNQNGEPDGVIIIEEKSEGRIVLFDDDENGVPEFMLVDEDGNGIFEAKFEDEDQDEKMDHVYLDEDQDGHYERMQQL